MIGFDARLISALGIGRYINGLLPPLSDILQGRLLVVSRRGDLALVRALTEGKATLITSDAAPYRLVEQSAFLLTLLRARLDLVHFPHYNLPVAYPRRFVVTIHDLFSFRFPEIHSGAVPRLTNQALIANAVRRADAIIAPSRATAEDISGRFPSATKRVSAIGEAADGRFSNVRNPTAEAAWLRYFGITPPYFLSLGQWKSYKNLPLLIEAFSRFTTRRPGVQLVIAGHDPRHPEVPAATSALPPGSVVMPGHLPEDAVPDLYRAAAAVIIPSLAEGFGLPVLEAMACGVVVVSSDIPALKEIADGIAIFCDPSSPESFAAGMMAALELPPGDTRIQDGLTRARSFSWRKAAEATVSTYERVLAARPNRRSDIER